jgi:hypothetical protein
MTPAFKMNPFRVFTLKQVVFKICIRRSRAIALKMGFTAGAQFGFFGVNAAIGAIKNKHTAISRMH